MGLVAMGGVCPAARCRGRDHGPALWRGRHGDTADLSPAHGGSGRPAVGSRLVSAVDLLIAAGVALVAGVLNSIAGGGSLILFPTLVALGLDTVAANVTNSVSQWPGYLGGVAGFRDEYAGQRDRLIRFGIVAALGGTAGSVLLLTRRLQHEEDGVVRRDPAWLYVALFLAAVYGGYFGGALGVILVGVLGAGLHRLKLANALKSALS